MSLVLETARLDDYLAGLFEEPVKVRREAGTDHRHGHPQ
jgi:hypothetical protein